MTKAIIIYASMSGNTEEVADLIGEELYESGIEVDEFDIWDYEMGRIDLPDLSGYDAILLGTYTWGEGDTPDEVKNFVADVGYKPDNVYVFGTGETQFGGDDLFCLAAEKLANFYHSPVEPLKIEQSPRGSQEEKVIEWARNIIEELSGRRDLNG